MKILRRFFNWLFRRKPKIDWSKYYFKAEVVYGIRPVRPTHIVPIIYKRKK